MSNAIMFRGVRGQNKPQDDIDNLVKILSQQFSFRESKKVENSLPSSPYIRPQYKYFQMRAILQATNSTGRLNKVSADLAVNLFARMLSRRLWRDKVFCNRKQLENGLLVNYDQRDLMIIARRVARRVLRRKLGS